MASIIWLDLEGKRHKPRKEYNDLKSFRSYIKKNKDNIKVVELLDCKGLDTLYDKSMDSGLFEYCTELVEVKDVVGTLNVEDMSWMFKCCYSLESVPYFDTFNVTDMNHMFFGCDSLESVSNFNTSKVENMEGMFNGCYNLKEVPHFDTLKVKNMDRMFEGCSNLNYVPFLSVRNINRVDTMRSVFFRCDKFLEYLSKMGNCDNPRISEVFNIIKNVRRC